MGYVESFKLLDARGEIDAFLDSHGYSTMSIADAEALRAGYLAPSRRDALTLARGELVVVAERGHQP